MFSDTSKASFQLRRHMQGISHRVSAQQNPFSSLNSAAPLAVTASTAWWFGAQAAPRVVLTERRDQRTFPQDAWPLGDAQDGGFACCCSAPGSRAHPHGYFYIFCISSIARGSGLRGTETVLPSDEPVGSSAADHSSSERL